MIIREEEDGPTLTTFHCVADKKWPLLAVDSLNKLGNNLDKAPH